MSSVDQIPIIVIPTESLTVYDTVRDAVLALQKGERIVPVTVDGREKFQIKKTSQCTARIIAVLRRIFFRPSGKDSIYNGMRNLLSQPTTDSNSPTIQKIRAFAQTVGLTKEAKIWARLQLPRACEDRMRTLADQAEVPHMTMQSAPDNRVTIPANLSLKGGKTLQEKFDQAVNTAVDSPNADLDALLKPVIDGLQEIHGKVVAEIERQIQHFPQFRAALFTSQEIWRRRYADDRSGGQLYSLYERLCALIGAKGRTDDQEEIIQMEINGKFTALYKEWLLSQQIDSPKILNGVADLDEQGLSSIPNLDTLILTECPKYFCPEVIKQGIASGEFFMLYLAECGGFLNFIPKHRQEFIDHLKKLQAAEQRKVFDQVQYKEYLLKTLRSQPVPATLQTVTTAHPQLLSKIRELNHLILTECPKYFSRTVIESGLQSQEFLALCSAEQSDSADLDSCRQRFVQCLMLLQEAEYRRIDEAQRRHKKPDTRQVRFADEQQPAAPDSKPSTKSAGRKVRATVEEAFGDLGGFSLFGGM